MFFVPAPRLALAALLACCLPALADWPRYMGPDHTGVVRDEKIARTWPAEGPRVLWTVDIGPGYASPAIVNGKVYFLDRPRNGIDQFRVFDLDTGKEQWALECPTASFAGPYSGSRGTPTIDGNFAYSVGPTGEVRVFDLTGRKVHWAKSLQKDFGSVPGRWGYAQSPLILGEKVILDIPGSPDAGAVALHKQTGAVLWKAPPFGKTDCYTSPLRARIAGVEQVLLWHKKTLASVDAAAGKLLWTFDWEIQRPIVDPVVLPDDKLFLTTGYGNGCALLKITRAEGKPEHKATAVFQGDPRSGSKTANAIFYQGHIYTAGSDKSKGLQCLDTDGNVKWESPRKFSEGTLLLADGVLFVLGGNTGTLTMVEVSPADYKELATVKLLEPKQVWAPMALSGGKLIVRDLKQMKCVQVGL